jgi:hypothetical protein
MERRKIVVSIALLGAGRMARVHAKATAMINGSLDAGRGQTLGRDRPTGQHRQHPFGVCDNFQGTASGGFVAARPAKLLITASNSAGSTGFAK